MNLDLSRSRRKSTVPDELNSLLLSSMAISLTHDKTDITPLDCGIYCVMVLLLLIHYSTFTSKQKNTSILLIIIIGILPVPSPTAECSRHAQTADIFSSLLHIQGKNKTITLCRLTD